MPNYAPLIAALKALTQNNITGKDDPESVDPVDVGGTIESILDEFLTPLNSINEFNIDGGSVPPDNGDGDDLDVYFELGASFKVWKKRNGVWINNVDATLGINIIDGNINVQVSVNEDTVTASSGQWGLNNTIYEKITQTEFTVPTADLNFDRIDLVSGDISNEINYTAGVASSTPAQPVTPSNSVRINFIYVPSSSSGNLPYVLDSNSPPVVPPQLAKLMFNDGDLVNIGEDAYVLPVIIPPGRMPLGVIIDYGGGNVQYMPGGNYQDGVISGFTNNNTSIITVKLG